MITAKEALSLFNEEEQFKLAIREVESLISMLAKRGRTVAVFEAPKEICLTLKEALQKEGYEVIISHSNYLEIRWGGK